jgi:hypothetical protein
MRQAALSGATSPAASRPGPSLAAAGSAGASPAPPPRGGRGLLTPSPRPPRLPSMIPEGPPEQEAGGTSDSGSGPASGAHSGEDAARSPRAGADAESEADAEAVSGGTASPLGSVDGGSPGVEALPSGRAVFRDAFQRAGPAPEVQAPGDGGGPPAVLPGGGVGADGAAPLPWRSINGAVADLLRRPPAGAVPAAACPLMDGAPGALSAPTSEADVRPLPLIPAHSAGGAARAAPHAPHGRMRAQQLQQLHMQLQAQQEREQHAQHAAHAAAQQQHQASPRDHAAGASTQEVLMFTQEQVIDPRVDCSESTITVRPQRDPSSAWAAPVARRLLAAHPAPQADGPPAARRAAAQNVWSAPPPNPSPPPQSAVDILDLPSGRSTAEAAAMGAFSLPWRAASPVDGAALPSPPAARPGGPPPRQPQPDAPGPAPAPPRGPASDASSQGDSRPGHAASDAPCSFASESSYLGPASAPAHAGAAAASRWPPGAPPGAARATSEPSLLPLPGGARAAAPRAAASPYASIHDLVYSSAVSSPVATRSNASLDAATRFDAAMAALARTGSGGWPSGPRSGAGGGGAAAAAEQRADAPPAPLEPRTRPARAFSG